MNKKQSVSRGFVTMATGKRMYYILARNLLISYRLHNPQAFPFAIICDRKNKYTEDFDDVVIMDSPMFSFNDKLRLADLVPYDETIFIDADCLILKSLDGLWDIVDKSPDFGIYGAVYDAESEKGQIELKRSGSLREKMRFFCTCQGGMRFVRKSPKLTGFTDLCLYIYDHYDEFQMPGHPKPSDDMIFPLACSVFNFPPSEDWSNIFCWFPESEIIDLDVVKGKTKYIWKVINREQGPDCYFIHFSSIATKEWLYKRESYRLLCHVKGKRPSGLILGIMYAYCRMVRLYHIALYRTKMVVLKCLSILGYKKY